MGERIKNQPWIMRGLLAVWDWLSGLVLSVVNAVVGVCKAIGKFFAEFGLAFWKGDLFVKLSVIWWGAGYARRKQFIKAIIMTAVEALVIWYTLELGLQYATKFDTLGTVQLESVFNMQTMQMEFNDYDNSFMILLFSMFSFVVWAVAAIAMMRSTVNCYKLQLRAEAGLHVNNFWEDVQDYLDSKFHITLLALPVTGIVIFTVIPILLLIFVAFTNYDANHMPPAALFTWVGFDNFVNLFTNMFQFGEQVSATNTFGYAFTRVLAWTLVWSFFATLTNYFGGILMSLLLNSKLTKCSKLWRTMLVVTIAVPQFVSLLLMRHFFANNGLANAICEDIGLTKMLIDAGFITTSYIPFLSAPGWAHVMIILINIWVGIPYQMLIATGVLMNLPQDQVESARIDGASPFQIFRHITMPYMLQVTGPALVTDFVKNFNNFNVIYLLTKSVYVTTDQFLANAHASEVDLLVTWLFSLTQDYYNYKMASVLGIMVFIVCSVITLIGFNFMTGGDKEETYQ